jgi:hypothetical protein
MPMKRNLSNEASEKHWDFVKRVSDRVSQWPAWKRAQFRTIMGDPQGENFPQNSLLSDLDLSEDEATAIRRRQAA